MKPGKIIGIILGGSMMFFAIGAYFSNEPSANTQNGRIAIVFSLVMGFLLFINNVFPNKSNDVHKPTKTNFPKCPSCSRKIEETFKVCPFCQYQLKPTCPFCGKDIKSDYLVCPYCNTNLK